MAAKRSPLAPEIPYEPRINDIQTNETRNSLINEAQQNVQQFLLKNGSNGLSSRSNISPNNTPIKIVARGK